MNKRMKKKNVLRTEHGDQHSRTMDKRQVQRVRGFSVILLLYPASLLGVTLVKW